MASKTKIAGEALLALQKLGIYNGLWLSDETVTRLINRTYNNIKDTGGISRTNLNRAASPKGVHQLQQCGTFSKVTQLEFFVTKRITFIAYTKRKFVYVYIIITLTKQANFCP